MARPRRPPLDPRLADFRRAVGLTQEQVAERMGITAEMVRRHERGISLPTAIYRERYCRLYGQSEEALGLRPAGVSPTAATRSATSAGPQPLLPVPSLRVPEYGDDSYLETVKKRIQEIVALDNYFGGTDLTQLSKRFFRTIRTQLSTGAYEPDLEKDLQAAAGELAEVTGWLAYDAAQHDLVRRMNDEALYFTRLAGDAKMELLTLQNASMHAGFLGRPGEALHLANSVLEGPYNLSPRLHSLFLTRKARALAQGGDHSALRLFDEIRSLYLNGPGSTDPAWAWWVDERELSWHEAMACQDLGMSARAVPLFERSVAATGPKEVRSRYLHRAYLFAAQMQVRSWENADATMAEIMPLVGEVASTRTVVFLRETLDTMDGNNPPANVTDRARQLREELEMAPI